MQAVADALSLLANIVMAWNTTKMQSIFDRWAQRRSGAIPPELIARIAPKRRKCIDLEGRQGVVVAGEYRSSDCGRTGTRLMPAY
jgi:hypothetical protein